MIKHTRDTVGRGDRRDRAPNLTHNIRTLHARTSEEQNASIRRANTASMPRKKKLYIFFLLLRVMKTLCQANKDEPEHSEEQ